MERTIITCDKCNVVIGQNGGDSVLVNAKTYGAHFHMMCLITMSATELIVALSLDDIRVEVPGSNNSVKADSYFKTKPDCAV